MGRETTKQEIEYERAVFEVWGFIPDFLDEEDPRPAREQFNARYIGGWNPFPGFTLNIDSMELRYPGDPPMDPISCMIFRNEMICIYPSSWVLILQGDATWEVARMD